MKRIRTDWNNIKHDGSVVALLRPGETVPEDGEMVWSVDSGERVLAEVVRVGVDEHGMLLLLIPNWGTQEDDPDDTPFV
jgi:hypothetical protein